MKRNKVVYWRDMLVATGVVLIGFLVLRASRQTGLVDMSIEGVLFFAGSMMAFWGYRRSRNRGVNKYFVRFQLFYGITYLTVAVAFSIGIYYYVGHPRVIELEIDDVMGNSLLMVMNTIKSSAMVFLILTWCYFYRYLGIKITKVKMVGVFLIGFSLYLGGAMMIWLMTGDVHVISLGVIVGIAIGVFALIALDSRTRYLTIIFALYSSVHLIEFYMMGQGMSLTSGFNNLVYWWATVLYVLEVRRWITTEISGGKCYDKR